MACTSEKIVSSTEVQCDPPSPELMKGKTDKSGNAEVVVSNCYVLMYYKVVSSDNYVNSILFVSYRTCVLQFTLGNYQTSLGALKYKGGAALHSEAIISIVVGVVALNVLIIVILIIICICRKKRAKKYAPSVKYSIPCSDPPLRG